MNDSIRFNQPTSGEVRRSIRHFQDHAHDVLRADSGTFADRMSYLAHFCETDAVFTRIHAQLMNHPDVNFNEWAKTHGGPMAHRQGPVKFPNDADQRVALMYQLWFFSAKNPRPVLNNVRHWFRSNGTSLTDHIRAFSNAVLDPMFRELVHRLRDIGAKLPPDEQASVSVAALQIVHIKTDNILMQNNTFENSKNIQIGNQNTQDNREINLNLTLQEISDQIDNANASDSTKAAARNRLQEFLAHPLVSAIVGGATSAVLTPR